MYNREDIDRIISDKINMIVWERKEAFQEFMNQEVLHRVDEFMIQSSMKKILKKTVERILDSYLIKSLKDAQDEAAYNVKHLDKKLRDYQIEVNFKKIELQNFIDKKMTAWFTDANFKIDGICGLYESCTAQHHHRLMELEQKLKHQEENCSCKLIMGEEKQKKEEGR